MPATSIKGNIKYPVLRRCGYLLDIRCPLVLGHPQHDGPGGHAVVQIAVGAGGVVKLIGSGDPQPQGAVHDGLGDSLGTFGELTLLGDPGTQ